ncbi:MAG TPA: hypothetical protein P5257_10335 [Bacteroidales bacterium]|nr:hypothetical protein [Bacteroidales bacterium]
MYRKLFSFAVMTVTILAANLITNTLGNYLITYRNHVRPVTFTVIGMIITVAIFYPLFVKLEEWVEQISADLLKQSRTGILRYLGLIFAFLGCLLVLVWFYAKMWYRIDLLKIVVSGSLGLYI